MMLLTPPDNSAARQASPGDVGQTHDMPRRAPRRRILSATIALIGMLMWASFTAPQIIALAPQVASYSATTTGWLSRALSSAGHPSALALGSVATPAACSSSGASAIGSNLLVPAGAWVCGDALAVGGNVDVRGRVQGSTQAIGGNVTISGEVDGDVTAVGGDIRLQPGAITRGRLDSVGGQVIVEPGASAQTPPRGVEQYWYGAHNGPTAFHVLAPEASSFWLGLLFWVSATLGLSAFLPEVVGHVRYTIARRFIVSGVTGAVIGLIGAVLGAVLFVTCIGIPVTVAIAVAMWIAWVVGTVAFASWLGASLLRGVRLDSSLLVSTLLGVVILSLLKAAPIVGPVVSLIVGVVGLGAALLTLLSARRVSYARLRW